MNEKKILVLVTGATGFIGRHLCIYLSGIGYRIRATFRGISPPNDYPENISWVNVGDIGHDTKWTDALDGVCYVIHLAALAHQIGENGKDRKNEFYEVNVSGTENLIKEIKHKELVKRFIYISSVSVYNQDLNKNIDELTACNPVSDYGYSKYEAEKIIQKSLKETETDWCILRPALVYGSGNPGNMERLQRLISLGLPLPFSMIENKRSFIFVGNLVDAISKCIIHPLASRRVYLISDGFDVSTKDLINKIGEVIGKRVVLLPVPISILKLIGRIGDYFTKKTNISFGIDTYSLDKLTTSFTVDSSLIRTNLNWLPPYSIDDGLKITLTSKKKS
ncbi:MAG: NAD-dependent epimerase/dehydratase family protein [Bacteroidetes bacterium]|nr:NAD-dependent epimerase/dehydratase family protein [Bacteroidota bacterium]